VSEALVIVEVKGVEFMERAETSVRPSKRPRVVARVLDQLRGQSVITRVWVAASTHASRFFSVVRFAIVVPDRVPQGRVHLQARDLTVKLEVRRVSIDNPCVDVIFGHSIDPSERVRVVVGVVNETQENARVGAQAAREQGRNTVVVCSYSSLRVVCSDGARRMRSCEAIIDGVVLMALGIVFAELCPVRPGGRSPQEALFHTLVVRKLAFDLDDPIGSSVIGAHGGRRRSGRR